MKRICPIVIFFVFIMNTSYAQWGKLTKDKLKVLKSATTYFILEADSLYNSDLKDAVKQFWTLGKYEFVTAEQAKKVEVPFNFVVKDQKGVYAQAVPDGGSFYMPMDALVLTVGIRPVGRGGAGLVPLANWDSYVLLRDGATAPEYGYKLGAYIQILQYYVKTLEDSGKEHLNGKKTNAIYNQSKNVLKTKTLLVSEFDLLDHPDGNEVVKSCYKNDCKIVAPDVIYDIVKKQDQNSLILYTTYSYSVYYYYVVDPKDGKVVYANWIRSHYYDRKLIKKALRDLSK